MTVWILNGCDIFNLRDKLLSFQYSFNIVVLMMFIIIYWISLYVIISTEDIYLLNTKKYNKISQGHSATMLTEN
jgi:hypothetical protein